MTTPARWLLLFVLAAPRPTTAQRVVVPVPAPSRLYVSLAARDTARRELASYNWREPALITGAVTGSLIGLVSVAFCGDSDSGSNTPPDQCPAFAGVSFLVGAAFGGTIAAVLAASPRPPKVPPGEHIQGNRGRHGALVLGLPSLGVMVAAGLTEHCRNGSFRSSGCSAGSIAAGVAMVAVNAGIGYLIGKGIPAFRADATGR